LNKLARLTVAAWLCASSQFALADHIDPYEIAGQAGEVYGRNESYAEVRAHFSRALRDARHDGPLPPEFAIVYTMYSDTARFDGDPSFALQLANEGLALITDANEPDEDAKNSLLVSRAYALADMGQYEQAVEAVAITALWMGKRFGAKEQADLEAIGREWSAQAAAKGGDGKFPSAVQLAIDLLGQADEALGARDTRTALALASRAALPEGTSLSQQDVAFLNARAFSIAGQAYAYEGRAELAYIALRRAANLVLAQPWDGVAAPVLRPESANDEGWRSLTWTTFAHLASASIGAKEMTVAQAALDLAAPLARTSEDRFSLMVQQAGLAFWTRDHRKAEAVFLEGQRDAEAAGDTNNAALARVYVAIARLSYAGDDTVKNRESELLGAASAAADTMADNPQMVEYVLTTAVRMAVGNTGEAVASLPLARRAFDVFRERQKAIAGYDAVQEAGRRDRRRFLEMLVEGEYAAAEAAKN
jgi:tetratricopeptide (TPR) repeat protein